MSIKRATLSLSVAGLMASAVGIGSTTAASSASSAPIKIGISLSLSGDFSADGVAFQKGYTLWKNYVNAHGGILGRKVSLDIVNDGSDPTQVATNYQKLITLDHVNMVFGPFSTLLTVPSAKIAARYGYNMIEGAGGGPSAFALGLTNLFDVSAPVSNALVPFAKWLASLPKSERPKTAAYPTSNDPFTEPQLVVARKIMEKAGVRTVYSAVFGSEVTDFTPIAQAVVAANADVVFLGSVDVPTVSAFMQDFIQQHYNPKAFIATGGPDQGAAFQQAVGSANVTGMMVPNTWYPGVAIKASKQMVNAYVKAYGGTASQVNADVAEAYSVGQVAEAAIKATGGTNQKSIKSYLHGGHTFATVQGPVKFNSLGENTQALIFGDEWINSTTFQQVLPKTDPNSSGLLFPKPNWGA